MSDRDVDYLQRLHRNPAPLLLELEQLGNYDDVEIVDRATGRFLSTMVHAMQANRILELGTAYGYATLWMALAMPPQGRIWTVDPNRAHTEIAREFLERAGKSAAVEIINQPALDILRSFPQRNLDIVFIDAAKTEFTEYLNLVVPLLKPSGLVLADDLLWSGRSATVPDSTDSIETRAIREFNRAFLNHPQLESTILPIGDGLGIGARTHG